MSFKLALKEPGMLFPDRHMSQVNSALTVTFPEEGMAYRYCEMLPKWLRNEVKVVSSSLSSPKK